MHRVEVEKNTLEANGRIAAENRALFKRLGAFVVNVMSAPGAGKTSVLEQTIKLMKENHKIGVIEGDLHTTIDADRISALGVGSYQITTGTVCHLDARMIRSGLQGFNVEGLDLLFIENVGNLVRPVEFDLGEDSRVMVFSVVEGADKPRKYPVMFHEVEAVLLNKIDLVPYSEIDLPKLMSNVLDVNPEARIFPVSCRTGAGLGRWTKWLEARIHSRASGGARARSAACSAGGER